MAVVKTTSGSVRALAFLPSIRVLMGRSDGEERLLALLDDRAIRDGIVVRIQAVRALGEMRAVAAVEPIGRLLTSDERRDVRSFAAIALGKIGSPSGVGPLIRALGDEGSSVRSVAAENLGRIRGSTALAALCEALKDDSTRVRTSAAEALGRLSNEAAIPALTNAARRNRFIVRVYAIVAIGEIGGASANEALAELRRRIRNPALRLCVRGQRRALKRASRVHTD